mgnify:CR=1 FL=1
MKKLLSSLFVISALLLSGIYLVGERTENEIQKMFAKSEQQGVSTELFSYDKQFLKATVISQVTLVEGEKPVVFTVTSAIQHYPHKAVINNQIRLLDPELAGKAQDYFASENWISSCEEISLQGNLTGQLQLLPGRYSNAQELFATKALYLDYQFDLQDHSGAVNLSWHGLDVWTNYTYFSVESVKFIADFAALPIGSGYDYFADIAEMVIRQKNTQVQLQGIELLGSSRFGEQTDTLDSSHEWKVAAYQIDNDVEKVFTDNSLKLDLKGLYSPALMLLSHSGDDQQQIAKALTELIAHGGQLSLTELTSQTPWGKVYGALDIMLQQGARLPEIVDNPFMLLDYISGNANLLLPEALLQLPALSELLQVGLQSGFLKRQKQILSLDTQFEQGELTVNGRVIPL